MPKKNKLMIMLNTYQLLNNNTNNQLILTKEIPNQFSIKRVFCNKLLLIQNNNKNMLLNLEKNTV